MILVPEEPVFIVRQNNEAPDSMEEIFNKFQTLSVTD